MPFVIIVIGASGIIAQIVLIRELLVNFQGNELSIGIILGNWLITEALGSYLFRRLKISLKTYQMIILVFALIFPIICIITGLLRPILGILPGEIITLPIMFFSSLLILLPIGFLHGTLFTSTASYLEINSGHYNNHQKIPGYVYVLENIGTVIGGVIISFLLIPYFNSLQIAIGLAVMNLFTLLFITRTNMLRVGYYALIAIFGLLLFFSNNITHWAVQQNYPNYNVLYSANSIYSNITVTNREEQHTFLIDGTPVIITPHPDQTFVEDIVNFPMLAHRHPEHILLISGGAGGVLSQMLKYPIKEIQYLELDPSLIQVIHRFPTELTEQELSDPRVKIITADARHFLETAQTKYDVIFVNFLAPLSLQTNRFFTREFFSICQEKLNTDGILVTLSPGSLTYINLPMANLISSHLKTLENVFSNTVIIPGDYNIFISSLDRSIRHLNAEILYERLISRKITSNLFTPGYIQYRTQKHFTDWLENSLQDKYTSKRNYINQDGKPKGLFYNLFYKNTIAHTSLQRIFTLIEKINLNIILIVLLIILAFMLLIKKRGQRLAYIPFALFTTGITAMVFSLVLSLGFQIRYGYLYYQIGILLTTFIAGAALGGYIGMKKVSNKRIYILFIELMIIMILLIFLFSLHNDTYPRILNTKLDFLILLLVSGFLVGWEFPVANRIYNLKSNKTAATVGKLYAADLLGGFIGTITISVIFIPVLGIYQTILIAIALKIISALLILTVIGFSIE